MKTSPTPFDGRVVKGKVLGTFIKGHASFIDQTFNERIIK